MQHCYFIVDSHGEEAIDADRGRYDPAEQMFSSGTDKWVCWSLSTENFITPLGCPSPRPAGLPAPGDPLTFWASPGAPLPGGWEASAVQLQNMNSRGCGTTNTRLTSRLTVLLGQLSHEKVGGCGSEAQNKQYSCCLLHMLSAVTTRHSRKKSLPYSWRRFPALKGGFLSRKAEQNQSIPAGRKAGREVGVDGRRRHQCPILEL